MLAFLEDLVEKQQALGDLQILAAYIEKAPHVGVEKCPKSLEASADMNDNQAAPRHCAKLGLAYVAKVEEASFATEKHRGLKQGNQCSVPSGALLTWCTPHDANPNKAFQAQN